MWKKTIKFKDLLSEYNHNADELEEIKRIKPIWNERIKSIECIKYFSATLKKVKTLTQFDSWLCSIYDYCDYNRIWVD